MTNMSLGMTRIAAQTSRRHHPKPGDPRPVSCVAPLVLHDMLPVFGDILLLFVTPLRLAPT